MRKLIAAVLMATSLATAQAATEPEELVKSTTDQVLATLEANREQIEKDPQAVIELVKGIVLPKFDFDLMSRLVLARHWRSASPEQQQRFTEEFRQLLIRTYGTSLAQYSGQKVNYLPMQAAPEKGRATVRMEILQSDGPAIPVSYQLRESKGEWKVFDVVIDGVSLVQNYRTSFASDIQNRGLDALIQRLAERNQSGATGA